MSSAQTYKIAIVGSGPGGLSAACRAAEMGDSHILLEAQPHLSNTIFRYQKGKHVMAEPNVLPLRAAARFEAGTREKILGEWDADAAKAKINLRHRAEVVKIEKLDDHFRLSLQSGEQLLAEKVVLGIGVQGNPRKMGVPGEDLPGIQYQLGPMSKTKPSDLNCLARPPGVAFFSKTVTSNPSLARLAAADRPATPEPITIAFFIYVECLTGTSCHSPLNLLPCLKDPVLYRANGNTQMVCDLVIFIARSMQLEWDQQIRPKLIHIFPDVLVFISVFR